MQDNATEVTAAGIARLAGVGRAAVSNWRRRHADFPKPVGGTESSPSFALAEVEAWLRKQGKLAEVPLRERVWQQLAGHPEGPLTALVHTGCVLLLIHERPTVWLDASAGSDARLAAMLPGALDQVLTPRFGGAPGGTVPDGPSRRAVGAVNGPLPVNTGGEGGSVNPTPQTPGVNSAADVTGVNAALTAPAVNSSPTSPPVNTPPAVHTAPTIHDASAAAHPTAVTPQSSGTTQNASTGQAAHAAHAAAATPAASAAAAASSPSVTPATPTPAVPTPTGPQLLPSAPLLRGAAELAAEAGARQTFEFLLGRHLDANPRQYTLTPADLAGLMADLAGPARTVLDPACGTGALLRAVDARPEQELYAQDGAPELAALSALRLALHSRATVRAAAGDTLRADAHPGLRADAVLCHPPFNERNWGHDELAYDPRWEYGFPARTESELAWVQHALARLADGGTAVLLMPPATASRRSGRRIRADLLRRGALRAVVALPVGAAPPYNIPLHLWVLRRPDRAPATPEVLLVDTGRFAGEGRGGPDWAAVREAVLDAWRSFAREGRLAERPGLARSLPVIELLDDDVDLAPARHLPPAAVADGAEQLTQVRERLGATLRLTADLTPPPADPAPPVRWPLTTVGELARGGALVMRTGGNGGHARVPVLTDHDVLAGTAPSGTLPESEEEAVLTEPGDVVVPVLGGGSVARVIDDATGGAALGRNLVLLRPDRTALDPWFLAGFLRGTANNRQASSYASTATRLDVRRLQLPRLPLEEQRRYGARFRALDEFERALRQASRLGEQLVRGMYDGLTDGTVAPD
ncbi:type I restriction-modification system subunit M/S [Streptomyces sp. SP2-10]|uniref:type I restriction-modification system subunit M/S n=1 Tax=Streptomyces sp. SP2-10 TaxID=2873385 RepID=UPI001CA61A99|nr:type I restriction-modification system subunit M/S [Streptomyces sp. SP2-10]MBY8844567.1 N-6 DNA methylase [Streptomyces sp. SP2-10]